MKLLIEIPEEKYQGIVNIAEEILDPSKFCYPRYLYIAVLNGTPIPKECGNIYAEKDIREQIENPYQCQTVLYGLELVKPIIKGESE